MDKALQNIKWFFAKIFIACGIAFSVGLVLIGISIAGFAVKEDTAGVLKFWPIFQIYFWAALAVFLFTAAIAPILISLCQMSDNSHELNKRLARDKRFALPEDREAIPPDDKQDYPLR